MYIVSIKGRTNCNLAGLILIPTLLKQNMIWYYVVYTLVKQVSAVRRDFIGLEKRLMCSKTCPFFWSEGKKMLLLTYCAWLTCICTAIFSHAITTFNLWMATEGWESEVFIIYLLILQVESGKEIRTGTSKINF